MKLLIDIGNTRLKAALWDGAALRPIGTALHAGRTDNVDFDALWKDVEAVAGVFVASVASASIGNRLAAGVEARFALRPVFCTSPASACGVRNAYGEPELLGVDRFLGMVALHAGGGGPHVLASCGTALTLDALALGGEHLGGLIAPSPLLMLDALTGAAARLAKPAAARVVEIADNTADAMESGVWLAGAALVERFVARATVRFGKAPALVLTGGGAARLGELIALSHRVENDLVSRGLAILADSRTDHRDG